VLRRCRAAVLPLAADLNGCAKYVQEIAAELGKVAKGRVDLDADRTAWEAVTQKRAELDKLRAALRGQACPFA
jgi:hypothetical protein